MSKADTCRTLQPLPGLQTVEKCDDGLSGLAIEAGLHWIRDVVFGEDHSQVRTSHGSTNLACLRTLAVNALRLAGHLNIAAGLQQHARTPLLPLATLGLT
ncbi:hypothetical protein [Geodermatophilus sp. URMC 63]